MVSNWTEEPLCFECCGCTLVGALTRSHNEPHLGVVIVVGGPQYRAGSHRQFVSLARDLAQAGVAALRFDLRGMGDSEGERAHFESTHDDLRAAVDALCNAVPSVDDVVLWGLCDGASASALYAASDARVKGLALFNPWVRTEAGAARAIVNEYYGRRFLDPAFWRKLVRGRVRIGNAVLGAWTALRKARRGPTSPEAHHADLPGRIAAGVVRHGSRTLVVLSEHDLVAGEFRVAAASHREMAAALAQPHVQRRELAGADHTFSTEPARVAATEATLAWLRRCFPADG